MAAVAGQNPVAWRFGLANTVLVVASAALLIDGHWFWLVIAAAALMGPIDEVLGDDKTPTSEAGRAFYQANLYACAPLIALLAFAALFSVKQGFARGDDLIVWRAVIRTIAVGYLYALIGATVAHELTHRTNDPLAQGCARFLLALMLNTTFMIYHVHGHHRNVGYMGDAATARRGEGAFAFIFRTTLSQFSEAFRYEAERLRREGQSAWSWRNRALSGQLYSLAFVVAAWAFAGLLGILVFFGAALAGRFFHELMNYVQHYGLVRAEGERLDARHTWDSHRVISNALHYNLPRHSHHHLFAARSFWELESIEGAPTLPYGYQTMATVALIAPLWRRIMRPLLADWDRRFASEAERRLILERGWGNLV